MARSAGLFADNGSEPQRTVSTEKSAQSETITSEVLESAQGRLDLWVHNGRNYSGSRFSPDTQINRENVGKLELIWKYKADTNFSGMETSAIAYDNRIYITEGNKLTRLDPATGVPIWTWRADSVKGANRGAAVLDGRTYMSTIDAHLICLDADTGVQLWDRTVGDSRAAYSLTAAPLVVKDKVIVGVSGAASGIRGYIDAYDAKTGKRVWRFWVVPGEGEPGNETWEGDSWVHGGGSAWLTGTFDPELNLLYWGTGNPAPYFDGEVRKGDNLYTNSIVASIRILANSCGTSRLCRTMCLTGTESVSRYLSMK